MRESVGLVSRGNTLSAGVGLFIIYAWIGCLPWWEGLAEFLRRLHGYLHDVVPLKSGSE